MRQAWTSVGWRWPCLLVVFGIAACSENAVKAPLPGSGLDPNDIVSGYVFLTPETQHQQDDDFLNPGHLWVDEGEHLFFDTSGVEASCASCHSANGMSLADAATKYPLIDDASEKLLNLEGRINLCRTQHQEAEPLPYESDELLSLTAYVANLAHGKPMSTGLSAAEMEAYETGELYFNTRQGQFNLSCRECHDLNWGTRLRGDTISQGHSNGFPTYRLEWQTLGSLHRRFRDCEAGIRAEPREYGSDEYLALELYLRIRAQGLDVEAPAVRR